MIRRGEGGWVDVGGPLWSPGGEVIAFPLHGSKRNRTRATIRALPAAPHLPRPYGYNPPQGRRPHNDAMSLVDARRSKPRF